MFKYYAIHRVLRRAYDSVLYHFAFNIVIYVVDGVKSECRSLASSLGSSLQHTVGAVCRVMCIFVGQLAQAREAHSPQPDQSSFGELVNSARLTRLAGNTS